MAPPRRVCVTGGGGFIASWLVKLLLSRGYAVHATLRDPCDPKNVHLKQLDEAPGNLHLFKADVLNCETLKRAFEGCEGVFHLATPVPEDKMTDPESEVMSPAVKGTLNVLKVCSAMKVLKVIVLSSTAAVDFNPNWPQDKLKDENCWSDKEFCKENEDWYSVAKIVAEQASFDYSEKNELNVVTLCPPLVFGPLLQPTVNTSSKFLIYVIKGGPDVMNNKLWHMVDVRDVADALLLVYEKVESSGRYICAPNNICTKDLVDLLKMYPKYSYVNNIIDVDRKAPITSQKLRDLGWEPQKLEETLMDSVECYEKAVCRIQLGVLAGFPISSVWLVISEQTVVMVLRYNGVTLVRCGVTVAVRSIATSRDQFLTYEIFLPLHPHQLLPCLYRLRSVLVGVICGL